MNQQQYELASQALRNAEALGVDVKAAWRDLEARRATVETGQPSADDLLWPIIPALPVSQHLKAPKKTEKSLSGAVLQHSTRDEDRPVFSCAIVQGRAYSLTAPQRDVMRDRFNFTSAKWVEVMELAVYPGTNVPCKVVLKSCEHIDTRRGAQTTLQQITITKWGEFMSACRKREVERMQQAEVDKRKAQVERLFKRADEAGVEYDVKPGTVAHQFHAQCEQKGLTTASKDKDVEKARQKAVREELRIVLLSKGETALAELVNEPNFVPDRDEGDEPTSKGIFGAGSTLDDLLASLMIRKQQ